MSNTLKFHEINHPSYGVIKFSSKLEDDHLIFEALDGRTRPIGYWDHECGGGLFDELGDIESDLANYEISERLIYNAVATDYPNFFLPNCYR